GGIVLCGHTDVMPQGALEKWHSAPFTLTRKGEVLTGRGAVDMKGSVASFLVTLAAVAKGSKALSKPLGLALSWGEEIGCKGADDMVTLMEEMHMRPETVLIGEPTDGEIALAHKGAMNLNFVFQGISGHSGYPKEGVSAMDYGLQLMSWLKKLEEQM